MPIEALGVGSGENPASHQPQMGRGPEQSPAGTNIPWQGWLRCWSGTRSGTDFAWARIGAGIIPSLHGIEETVPNPLPCSGLFVPAPAQEEGDAADEFDSGEPPEMRLCPQPCSVTCRESVPCSCSATGKLHQQKAKGLLVPCNPIRDAEFVLWDVYPTEIKVLGRMKPWDKQSTQNHC